MPRQEPNNFLSMASSLGIGVRSGLPRCIRTATGPAEDSAAWNLVALARRSREPLTEARWGGFVTGPSGFLSQSWGRRRFCRINSGSRPRLFGRVFTEVGDARQGGVIRAGIGGVALPGVGLAVNRLEPHFHRPRQSLATNGVSILPRQDAQRACGSLDARAAGLAWWMPLSRPLAGFASESGRNGRGSCAPRSSGW